MTFLRNTLFAVIVFLSFSTLSAQSEQRGMVLEYQGVHPKTPLAGVSISAQNASATLSAADGSFLLQFRSLHAGSDIQMRRIDKSGYEVMNQEVVQQFRIGGKDQQPILVVMCSKVLLQQLRDGYRSVAAQRYEQQLKLSEAEAERLRKEGQIKEEEYNARLDSIEAEYEEKLQQLENYIDKFARIDLSQIDAYEQQIVALVQEGKFDDAIALYEQQDFPAKIRQSREARQKLTEMKNTLAQTEQAQAEANLRLRQSIDRQITLLKMAGGKENYLKAHQLLQQTYWADTTHCETLKEYAYSLRVLGDWEGQRRVLLSGLRSADNDIDRGKCYLDLMDYYWTHGQEDEALACAQRADSLMSPHQEAHPTVLTRGLPAWSSSMLRYYSSQEQYDACLPVLKRLEENWMPDSLQVQSLTTYIRLLGDMSEVYSHFLNHEKSVWCSQQAILLGEVMERRYPWNTVLCTAYSESCSTFMLEGRLDDGRTSARQGARHLGEMLDKTRVLANYLLAMQNYYTLLEALLSADEYTLADSIVQSVAARKVFEMVKPSSTGVDYLYAALYRWNESKVVLWRGDIAQAEQMAAEAFQMLDTSDEGRSFQTHLRPETEARIRLAQARYAEAASLCQQAIEVLKSNYAESEDAWDADNLSRSYLLLADIQRRQGETGKCKKTLKLAQQYALFEGGKLAIERMKK